MCVGEEKGVLSTIEDSVSIVAFMADNGRLCAKFPPQVWRRHLQVP